MDQASLVIQHFRDLGEKYPELRLAKQSKELWMITGLLSFSAQFNGNQIEDQYQIEIRIPRDYPDSPPTAREIGNRIPRDFHHSGDDLCLGEPGRTIVKFREEPTLQGFIERCLIPYLYGFSYKTKYGELPFGELSHGWPGILENYQEVFQVNDRKAILGLLRICAESLYNGHEKCPCGSQRHLRKCHGMIICKVINQVPGWLLKREYEILLDGLVGK